MSKEGLIFAFGVRHGKNYSEQQAKEREAKRLAVQQFPTLKKVAKGVAWILFWGMTAFVMGAVDITPRGY